MSVIVTKFGGTSVGNLDRMHHVANIVQRTRTQSGKSVAVVVSAMAGETNRLLELAYSSVQTPQPRELDALLATGEQVSTALLAMILNEMGIPAVSVSGYQAGIVTDRSYNNARIEEISTRRLLEIIDSGSVPVIAGFQGINREMATTTLGRGGSDITAVAVAAALQAESCYIYTDVKGVYSTDPGICKSARLLSELSHEEMLELASLGAKVLHPRAVFFAQAYGIPLAVLSTFEPEIGITWIVKEDALMEKPIVRGITYRTDEAKITIAKLPKSAEGIGLIFRVLAENDIFVDMISQMEVDDGSSSLSFTVPDSMSSKALEICQSLVPEMGCRQIHCERDIAKVSAVGSGMRYNSGVAGRFFSALAEQQIDVKMISTSEIKISVVVAKKYCELALRTLHKVFCENELSVELEPATELAVG